MEPSSSGQAPMPINVGLLSSTNSPPQMVPSPNIQTAIPCNLGFPQLADRQLLRVEPLSKIQSGMSANMGSQQLSSKNKQPVHVEPYHKAHTTPSGKLMLQQLLLTNKQPAQMEPTPKVQTSMSGNLSSQQSSSTKRTRMETSPKVQTGTSISSGLSTKNKRTVPMEKSPKVQSISSGHLLATSTNKRSAHGEPSPKVQSESFESVRSKLRESLTASLALVSEEQSKSQAIGKNSSTDTPSTPRQMGDGSQPGESRSITRNAPSCNTAEGSLETLSSNVHDVVQKHEEGRNLSDDVSTNLSSNDYTQMWKCDVQEFELKHASLDDDMSFSNDFVMKDELLQENGLCWASDLDAESTEPKESQDSKRPKLAHEEVTGEVVESSAKLAHTLATKIEAELFRLFGGVNKKYKEKGRSLLFNLKDPNNPELRERVLSGEIAPERLCSMTVEKLASKQLSEWRIAKAEELAQMVVLPDSDVDLRRLVKKTHKGEFQVEVDRDDTVSVEVALGANSLPQIPTSASETKAHLKSNDEETQVSSTRNEIGASESSMSSEKVDSGDQNVSNNLTALPHEKTDFIEELMVDELKDGEFLPPIVSLDEFMEALDSEPPFESLPMDTEQVIPPILSEKKSDSSDKLDSAPDNSGSKLDPAPNKKLDPAPNNLESNSDIVPVSLGSKSDNAADNLATKSDLADAISNYSADAAVDYPSKLDIKNTRADMKLKYSAIPIESDSSPPGSASAGEHVWEGSIQLNISSLVTVLGFFKSGDKTSTKDWPSFLEIKGRVRLDAFDKFLQELRLSRSRAIMVVHFHWKEGSSESGRSNLCETIDSYITDERVGFAEPAPGVELYFCPPHMKTTQMLENHLPKEHAEALAASDGTLIGIIVWRRALAASTMSPRPSSHHKHPSSRKQLISRKQQSSNANFTSKSSTPSLPVGVTTPSNQPPFDEPIDEPIDDVPPGFGPAATRDEDDLPEFDFFQGNTRSMSSNLSQGSGTGPTHSHGRPLPLPVDQMRELVYKYGQSETGKSFAVNNQPWNDDDDDIPEWRPNQDNQLHQPSPQMPPPLQFHAFHQQSLQPHLNQQLNQHLVQQLQPQQPITAPPHAPNPQQLVPLAAPLPVSLQPHMNMMQVVSQNDMQPAAWQQPGAWWPQQAPPQPPVDQPGFIPNGGLVQPCHFGGAPPVEGQYCGMMPVSGSQQNGVDWRYDMSRSGGI